MAETSSHSTLAAGSEVRRECPRCGYDVRSRLGECCPECGAELRAEELSGPYLPWARRRALGRFRAFWATVRMVLFRFRDFRTLIDKPADYRDAQRFRAVIVLLLYLPLLFGSLGFVAAGRGDDLNFLEFDSPAGAIAFNAVAHVCVLLFLLAVTGAPSYFFHPKFLPVERQNRAVALSYYAAAPLTLLLPAYVLIPTGLRIGGMGLELLGYLGVGIGGLCTIWGFIGWMVALRRLGNDVMGADRAWKVTMPLILIVAALAALVLVVVPLTTYYVAIILASLAD